MKRVLKRICSIALAAVIGFSLAACPTPGGGPGGDPSGGNTGGKTPEITRYVLDIRDISDDWDIVGVGKDGSSLFLKLNETTGAPIQAYFKPEKDSDDGLSFFFKENGLPNLMIGGGNIVYFGNFNGYKFDYGVIKPDNTIEYRFDNQTDINWDTATASAIQERLAQGRPIQIIPASGGRYIWDIFNLDKVKEWSWLEAASYCLDVTGAILGVASCVTAWTNPASAIGCGIFVASQGVSIAVEAAWKDYGEMETANDVQQTLISGLGCAGVIGGDLTALVDCASVLAGGASIIKGLVEDTVEQKGSQVKEAITTIEKRTEWVYVTGVTLDRTEVSLTVGQSTKLNKNIVPSNANKSHVTNFHSSNTNAAWVTNDGFVTAKAEGVAIIQVFVDAVGSDGKNHTYSADCVVFVTAAPTEPTNPPITLIYAIGDTGPGGGKIFYTSATGFTMTDNGQVCHYLEAAPYTYMDNDRMVSLMGSEYNTYLNTGTAIGTGRKNTTLILALDANARAAKGCKNCTVGDKTDWFLPSLDELSELSKNRSVVLNAFQFDIWSSSQWGDGTINPSSAWIIDTWGVAKSHHKALPYNSYWPIRAF